MDAQIPITYVLSNRKAAYGLERARKAEPPIPTEVFSLFNFQKSYQPLPPPSDSTTASEPASSSSTTPPASSSTSAPSNSAVREAYDKELAAKILSTKPDLVVLAGFMHILSEHFLDPFSSAGVKILNLHPALPGQFDGANAIQRAWDAFQEGKIQGTGVMVHEVIKEVDRGQPLVVREIPCVKGEDVAQLGERMHKVEHGIIVEATKKELLKLVEDDGKKEEPKEEGQESSKDGRVTKVLKDAMAKLSV